MRETVMKSQILKDLKDHYGFKSDTEFAEFLGIAVQTLSSWYRRNSFDIDLLYSKCINIDANFLLTGKGNIEKRNVKDMLPNETVTKTVTFSGETKNTKNVTLTRNEQTSLTHKMPLVVTVDSQGKDNIVMVPVSAQAGYLSGYGDQEFIQTLPTFRLPTLNNGTFRMFQLKGHSMYPTMHDKSYVAAEWVENWVKDIKDNKLYVIVIQSDENEGVLVKRVLNRIKKYDSLYLKSDNRKEYPNITVKPSDIKEVWEVKLYLGWDLPDPALLYDRVGDLEAEMMYLKSRLKAKN